MEQNIMNIIIALAGLGATSLCPFAIRVLLTIRQKGIQELGAKEEAEVEIYAQKVINTISQKYGTLANEQKFSKAVFMIESKYGMNFLSESDIEVLIEDCVSKLKLAQGKLISDVTPVVIAPVIPTPEVTPVVEPIVEPVVTPVIVEPIVEPIVTPVAPVTPEVVVTPVITPEVPVVAPVVVPVALSDEITNAISSIVAQKVAEALAINTVPTVPTIPTV